MHKQEVAPNQSPRTRHEGNAVAHMREAIQRIESAINDATHGNYKGAMQSARTARDGLYFTEYELRKAETAALRKS